MKLFLAIMICLLSQVPKELGKGKAATVSLTFHWATALFMAITSGLGTYADYLYRSTTLSIIFKFSLILTQLLQLHIVNSICNIKKKIGPAGPEVNIRSPLLIPNADQGIN